MLELELNSREFFDDKVNEFYYVEAKTLHLEHSLFSMSKWESKYHKSLFATMEKQMTKEETLDYIKMMSEEKVEDKDLLIITKSDLDKIIKYIEDPMTATTFMDLKKKSDINAGRKREIITAEIIYYWMLELGIPFECEKWHLNRLLTLIRVCSVKNANSGKGNKMNRKDTMAFNRALMTSRRAKGGH